MSKKEKQDYDHSRDYIEGLCNMSCEEIKDFIADIEEKEREEKNKHVHVSIKALLNNIILSTNMQQVKRFNPESGCSYEIRQHDKLTNLLYKDALFNRFIAKCVNNSKIEEATLIEMFAEFLTMISDCENREQDK